MKIKLCGHGALSEDVKEYFTVGKAYECNPLSITDEVFNIIGDDGFEHSPAIFRDGSKCAYLEESTGNLYWELQED